MIGQGVPSRHDGCFSVSQRRARGPGTVPGKRVIEPLSGAPCGLLWA